MGAAVFNHCLPEHHAAGIRPLEPRKQAQKRRLAAARRPQDGGQRAFGHVEVDTVEYHPGAERLLEPRDDHACQGVTEYWLERPETAGPKTASPGRGSP